MVRRVFGSVFRISGFLALECVIVVIIGAKKKIYLTSTMVIPIPPTIKHPRVTNPMNPMKQPKGIADMAPNPMTPILTLVGACTYRVLRYPAGRRT